jgi:poly(3-hydroxyalkanoate) synthetase
MTSPPRVRDGRLQRLHARGGIAATPGAVVFPTSAGLIRAPQTDQVTVPALVVRPINKFYALDLTRSGAS